MGGIPRRNRALLFCFFYGPMATIGRNSVVAKRMLIDLSSCKTDYFRHCPQEMMDSAAS